MSTGGRWLCSGCAIGLIRGLIGMGSVRWMSWRSCLLMCFWTGFRARDRGWRGRSSACPPKTLRLRLRLSVLGGHANAHPLETVRDPPPFFELVRDGGWAGRSDELAASKPPGVAFVSPPSCSLSLPYRDKEQLPRFSTDLGPLSASKPRGGGPSRFRWASVGVPSQN